MTLVISRENLHEEDAVRKAIAAGFPGTRVLDDLGTVSVIGAGINSSFQNLRVGSAALLNAGLRSRGQSTSSFRITWLMERARLSDAARTLHSTFIAEQGARGG